MSAMRVPGGDESAPEGVCSNRSFGERGPSPEHGLSLDASRPASNSLSASSKAPSELQAGSKGVALSSSSLARHDITLQTRKRFGIMALDLRGAVVTNCSLFDEEGILEFADAVVTYEDLKKRRVRLRLSLNAQEK